MGESNFEALLDRDFRWPTVGDKPFVQGSHWHENTSIAQHPRSRLVMMMIGYKKAGDLAVERATHYRPDRDTLVFPAVFNYRQFIELSLKYLIATYGPTVGVAANWKTHDLSLLWKTFSQVLEGYGDHDPDGANLIVEEIVAEFAKVDPASFSYRYPVDTRGVPIPMTHEHLDLRVLADVMEAVDGYFTGCDGFLDHLQSAGP